MSVEQTVECLEGNGWFPPVATAPRPQVSQQPQPAATAMEEAKDEGAAGAAAEEEMRAPSSV